MLPYNGSASNRSPCVPSLRAPARPGGEPAAVRPTGAMAAKSGRIRVNLWGSARVRRRRGGRRRLLEREDEVPLRAAHRHDGKSIAAP